MALIGKAMLTDGRTLDQLISPELYKQVIARAEKAGLPASRHAAHEAVDGGGRVDGAGAQERRFQR